MRFATPMRADGEEMAQLDLAGKTALITGAAVRIGKEISLALAQKGVHIVIHYNRSENHARELSAELTRKGVSSWIVQADFSDNDSFDLLIQKSSSFTGSLDILINNASIFPRSSLEELTKEALFTNIDINAWAPFALSRSFRNHVKQGSIINILDQRISSFDMTHVAYILSKHVLAALTRMTALSYAPDIRVNGIAPGLILPPPGESIAYLERLSGTVPLKQHGDAGDIADAAVYLASSTYLTGEILFVDGGRHLREYAL